MSLSVDIYKDLYTSRKPYDSSSSIHELKIYLSDCLDLVKGIVIHFDDAAELSNDLLASILPTYNATAPKRYWRYYKNLAGIYSEIDPPMYIYSLDTYSEIELTTANLEQHATTRHSLIHDTEFRELLLDRYPDNEVLIAGIIRPIPLDVSTNAKNGEILQYPEHLVQFNEYSFIEDLNTWITNHMDRWYNAQYLHADELYTASYYAVLYPAMFNAVLGLREDRIHTLEVHYFHVQQYLASHGLLDRFMDIMTHKQRLWLYRNIKYIKKHAGHDKTFKMLIKELLEPPKIPLDGYHMNLVNAELGIEPRFHTKAYATEQSVGLEHHDLDGYRRLESQQLENKHMPVQYQQNDIRHSELGHVRTKMLESTILDYEADPEYSELDILHDHWSHYAFTGRFVAHIAVLDLDANDTIFISVKDAYILMRLLFSKLTDTAFVIRPPEVVQVLERVDYNDYAGSADPVLLKQAVDFVNYNLPLLPEKHLSTRGFGSHGKAIYEAFNAIQRYRSAHTDITTQASIELMLNDIYKTVPVVSEPIDIDQWRKDTNITVNPSKKEDMIKMYTTIINDVTNYTSAKRSSSDIQAGFIDIMKQLSSYGVSYNDNANRRPVNLTTCITTHIVNIINYTVSELYVDTSNNALRSTSEVLDTGAIDNSATLSSVNHLAYTIDNVVELHMECNTELLHNIEHNYITMEIV